MPLFLLGIGTAIGGKSRIVIGLILVKRSTGYRIFLKQLGIAFQILFGQLQLRPGRCHLCIPLIGLLQDIAGINDHQHIARPHAAARLHIAGDNLPPYLKSHIGFITALYRTGICTA